MRVVLRLVPNFAQIRHSHRQAKGFSVVLTQKPKCSELSTRKNAFWNIFEKNSTPEITQNKKKPAKGTETVLRLVSKDKAKCDVSKISHAEGNTYKTYGSAYILQKDHDERSKKKREPKEIKVGRIMKDEQSSKTERDPMPQFESVGRRLIDLSERKLHPLYKRIMTKPTTPKPQNFGAVFYKTRSGPITPEEIPEKLKMNKEMFEQKNILHEFKKVEIPQHIIAPLVEIKKNERPTMQKRIESKEKEKLNCSK